LHIPHQGIAAMIAGTIARGRELLSVYGKHMAEGTALTALTVRDEMKVPPQIQKRKLIEEYLANTWAVSYGEYVDGKLGNLPPDVLSDIAKTVSGINLQCSLILGLFLGKTPFLFTVDESGAVLQADAFACIGSGWSIAQANMYRRRYSHRFRLGDAAYVVYESKRLSEVDPSVGPGTVLGVFSTDDMCLITHEGRKRLDEEMSKQCPSTLRKVEMPDTFFLSSKKNMASSEHEEKAVSQPSAGSTGQEKTEDGV